MGKVGWRRQDFAAGKVYGNENGKGKRIEVLFFGSNAVTGTVENVDKVTATIVFGMIFGAWSVTVPRTWIRKHEDRLLVELA